MAVFLDSSRRLVVTVRPAPQRFVSPHPTLDEVDGGGWLESLLRMPYRLRFSQASAADTGMRPLLPVARVCASAWRSRPPRSRQRPAARRLARRRSGSSGLGRSTVARARSMCAVREVPAKHVAHPGQRAGARAGGRPMPPQLATVAVRAGSRPAAPARRQAIVSLNRKKGLSDRPLQPAAGSLGPWDGHVGCGSDAAQRRVDALAADAAVSVGPQRQFRRYRAPGCRARRAPPSQPIALGAGEWPRRWPKSSLSNGAGTVAGSTASCERRREGSGVSACAPGLAPLRHRRGSTPHLRLGVARGRRSTSGCRDRRARRSALAAGNVGSADQSLSGRKGRRSSSNTWTKKSP